MNEQTLCQFLVVAVSVNIFPCVAFIKFETGYLDRCQRIIPEWFCHSNLGGSYKISAYHSGHEKDTAGKHDS